MNKVEILVTDMDDTLLEPETETIPEPTETMLKQWVSMGKQWIIATGRPQDHTKDVLNTLSIKPDFYITRSRYIHRGQSHNDHWLKSWNKQIKRRKSDQINYTERWMPILKGWTSSQNIDADFEDDHVMFEHAGDAEQAYHRIKRGIDDDFKVLRNRRFLTVVPAETGKGNCLKYLCQQMGWSESEILCVGDGMNDANMLDDDYNFKCAVVANAEAPLKKRVTQWGGRILEYRGGKAIEVLIKDLVST